MSDLYEMSLDELRTLKGKTEVQLNDDISDQETDYLVNDLCAIDCAMKFAMQTAAVDYVMQRDAEVLCELAKW